MLNRIKTAWSRVKRFFLDSETIFLARLQVLAGIVFTVLATFDPSVLAPIIGDKWFGPFLLIWGILAEVARRRNADDLK
jgi:hypothetical protein